MDGVITYDSFIIVHLIHIRAWCFDQLRQSSTSILMEACLEVPRHGNAGFSVVIGVVEDLQTIHTFCDSRAKRLACSHIVCWPRASFTNFSVFFRCREQLREDIVGYETHYTQHHQYRYVTSHLESDTCT